MEIPVTKLTLPFHRKQHRFTLIELLVVVAIIAILASMLLPTLNKAREKSMSIQCLSNTKQCALGINLYMSDFDSYFFSSQTYAWGLKLRDGNYITWGPLFCPKGKQSPSMIKNNHFFTYAARYFITPNGGSAYNTKQAVRDGKASNMFLVLDGAKLDVGMLTPHYRLHENNVNYANFHLAHGATGEHRFSGRPRGGGAGAGAGAGPGDARPVRHRLLPDHGGVAQPRRPDHGSGPVTPEQAEP